MQPSDFLLVGREARAVGDPGDRLYLRPRDQRLPLHIWAALSEEARVLASPLVALSLRDEASLQELLALHLGEKP